MVSIKTVKQAKAISTIYGETKLNYTSMICIINTKSKAWVEWGDYW